MDCNATLRCPLGWLGVNLVEDICDIDLTLIGTVDDALKINPALLQASKTRPQIVDPVRQVPSVPNADRKALVTLENFQVTTKAPVETECATERGRAPETGLDYQPGEDNVFPADRPLVLRRRTDEDKMTVMEVGLDLSHALAEAVNCSLDQGDYILSSVRNVAVLHRTGSNRLKIVVSKAGKPVRWDCLAALI